MRTLVKGEVEIFYIVARLGITSFVWGVRKGNGKQGAGSRSGLVLWASRFPRLRGEVAGSKVKAAAQRGRKVCEKVASVLNIIMGKGIWWMDFWWQFGKAIILFAATVFIRITFAFVTVFLIDIILAMESQLKQREREVGLTASIQNIFD